MTVNTRRVRDRRKLRFENVGEVFRDAEELAEAERRGTLRTTGNWTLGQAIGHVAAWTRFDFDGYPPMPRPPWFVRALAPLLKNFILNRGMPAGMNLRNVPGGTFAIEPMDTDRALRELCEEFGRLESQVPRQPNPLFCSLTHEEYIKLNLRHAELHFSFFHAE